MLPNLNPRGPYLSPKYSKKYKKMWEHPSKTLFSISENLKLLEGMCTKPFEILEFETLKV